MSECIMFICQCCGTELVAVKANRKMKYCSKKCSIKDWIANNQHRRKESNKASYSKWRKANMAKKREKSKTDWATLKDHVIAAQIRRAGQSPTPEAIKIRKEQIMLIRNIRSSTVALKQLNQLLADKEKIQINRTYSQRMN